MRRLAFFVMLGLALALAVPAGAAPSFVASQSVWTSTTSSEMHAAIGSTGVAAVPFTTGDGAVRVSVRRPGADWSQGLEVSAADAPTQFDARAVVAGDGSITVTWRRANTVWARRMAPTGTWEPAVAVSGGVNTPFHAVVAGNDAGDVAVAWQEGAPRIYLRVRRGGVWSDILTVSDQSGSANTAGATPELFVDPSGGVVVEFLQQNGSTTDWWSTLRELPAGSTTLGTFHDTGANPVTPATSLDMVGPVRMAGDSQGHVALAIKDATGDVWEDYWDRVDPPEGAISNGAGAEAVPGFYGPGDPFVAVVEGTSGSRNLAVYDRDGSSIWPTVRSLWSGADVSQLSAAWDEKGRALLAVKENASTPGPYMTTILREGGTWGSASRQHDHAYNVWDAAMNASGDGFVTWYSLDPTIWATPYDVSGPTTSLASLPAWTLGSSLQLGWTTRDTWATAATATVRRQTAPPAGAWSDAVSTAGTTSSQPLSRGETACFGVRATDPSGNTGAWSNTTCTAVPVDDRSLSGRKAWKKLTASRYYARTALKATAKGRALTYRTTGMRLALVASRCARCGSVKVLVNGVLARRISLKGAGANQVVFPISTYSSVRAVKVKIVTTSARKVVVDGLGVSRS